MLRQFDPFRIALGLEPGVRFWDMVAKNSDIDTGTVPETVWAAGGLATFRSAAAIVEVVSDSADDAAAGTGARTVTIYGLDANYVEIEETITLNGTSAVDGTKLFLRINSAEVATAGSGKTNAGNITLRDNGAGTTRAYIVAGHGHTQLGVYTVPAGKTLLFDGFYVTSRDNTGVVRYANINVYETHNAAGGARHIAWTLGVSGVFESPFTIPHPIPEKTDLEFVVTTVASNNTIVSIHAHGALCDQYL